MGGKNTSSIGEQLRAVRRAVRATQRVVKYKEDCQEGSDTHHSAVGDPGIIPLPTLSLFQGHSKQFW